MYKDFGALFRTIADIHRDKPAFIIKKKESGKPIYIEISFKKLEEDIRAFATSLKEKGLKGKKIAVIGKNCYEWMVAAMGTILAGSAVVPLDRALSETEVLDQTNRISADAFVFGAEHISVAEKMTDRVKICFEPNAAYADVQALVTEGYRKGISENCCVSPEQPSFYLFTSGTTSKSKIVMLSQKNILSNIDDMSKVENFYASDVNLALLPMHHTFGMVGVLMMLSVGATNVFCEGLRVQKALSEYKVTLLVGVPLILDNMRRLTEKTIKKEKLTFAFKLLGIADAVTSALGLNLKRKIYKPLIDKFGGSLRLIISGAAPLAPETADFFNKKGIEVIQGYGLTETSPVVAAENHVFKRSGSVGKAMPSVDIKIVNPGENGIGEIAVKGPNVMLGYYENEEMTAQVLHDGYFHTGDVGYIDKDGYVFVTGRIKNVIVLENGKNVYPEELESYIEGLEYVKDVMVYNNKQGKKDKITAVVVPDMEEVSLEEAKAAFEKDVIKINKRLAKYKQIEAWQVTDKEFDKTTTGKIKRY